MNKNLITDKIDKSVLRGKPQKIKRNILLPLVLSVLLLPFYLSAEENSNVLLDINFSSGDWIEVLSTRLPEGQVEALQKDKGLEISPKTNVNGVILNGRLHRSKTLLKDPDGDSYEYAFRMRNGKNSYIEFPELKNVGKITVYARNLNPTEARRLNVQIMDDESGSWNLFRRWMVPGYEKNTGDMVVLTVPVKSKKAVKLRLHRSDEDFLHIYRIIIEKR